VIIKLHLKRKVYKIIMIQLSIRNLEDETNLIKTCTAYDLFVHTREKIYK